MPVITFTPPHSDAVARQAQAIGAVFPSVVLAARSGAEWAWTALHRCVAPPATGYLRAAGAKDPDGAFERVFVHLAHNFASFGGDESDYKKWVFELAHRQVVEGLGLRTRRPSQADLRVLSRLSEGPCIPAAVERRHVQAAAAAAVAGPTVAQRHRGVHGRAAGTGVLATFMAMMVGPVGKIAAGAVLAAAVTTGALATDPLPRQAATPVAQQPADGDHGDQSRTPTAGGRRRQEASRTGVTGAAVGASKRTAAKPAYSESRKVAGLAKAAAAADQAGEHKDAGLAKAAAAPERERTPQKVRYRDPTATPNHPSSDQKPPRFEDIRVAVPQKAGVAALTNAVGTALRH